MRNGTAGEVFMTDYVQADFEDFFKRKETIGEKIRWFWIGLKEARATKRERLNRARFMANVFIK